ncbi:MAG TPA: RNA polymerase sigma factor [Dongiaceae bacterium]|nr:RNA polymerase sigma factor [Dongiaceae bacterium]
MASAGLMLQWEHRISTVAGGGTGRVEPAEIEDKSKRTSGVSEDAALAEGCRQGKGAAYERLYRAQGARMRNLARNLLGSPSDAEDAVQETFLKIQRSIGSFRGQSSFVTWTFRILVNTCYDMRRSRVRRKEHARDSDPEKPQPREPRAPNAHPSLRMALERALAELTKHQREVFLLYEVEGFRHSEIATMLEISETASKNTLFQAKRNLRGMLEPPRSAEAGGGR